MNDPQYREDIRTAILKHEMTIGHMEERLDRLNARDNYEPLAEMTKCQIEFIILNVEQMKSMKEQELRSMEEMDKWKESNPNPLGPFMPAPPRPALPEPPFVEGDEVVATRFYASKKSRNWGNLVYLMKSGKIMNPKPTVLMEEWEPGEDWELKEEIPVQVSQTATYK